MIKKRASKKIVGLLTGVALLISAAPVFADSGMSDQQEMAEKLAEAAGQLDPNSQESVETLSELLEQWDTESEETEGASVYAGTMTDSSSPSIQFLFEQLQLELAQTNKNAAAGYLDQIRQQQSQSALCSEVLNQLRQLHSEASSSQKTVAVSQELKDNLVSLEICNSNATFITNSELSAEDLQNLISLVETKQESIGSNVQQEMVYIQDYVGQYNSYIMSSNTAIEEAMEVLKKVTMGGTMLGGSTGMLFTGLLAGVVIGVVAALLIQKKKVKK